MVKASFWMLVGIFLFTLTAALAKVMASEGFGIWEIVFWRSIVGCLFCAAVMRKKGISPATRFPVRYVVRCTVGTVSIALSVYTLTVMPIATAQTLTNTGPLWFCVFLAIAALFTAYRFDKVVLLAVLAGFGGVLLILRPDVSQGITTTAAVAGVLSGFTSGGADFMIRHLTHKGEPGERIVFYIMLAGSVTGFLLAFGDGWHDVTPFSILLLFGLGFSATFAQIATTYAWAKGHALVNAVFSFSGIPFALLFGVALFGETIDLVALLGMAVVALAGIFATLRRLKAEQKAARLGDAS